MFRPIEPQRIKHAAISSKTWEKTCDLPDPIQLADIAHDPNSAVDIIVRAIGQGALLGTSKATTLRKVNGESRELHHIDPFSKVGMKVMTASVAEAVDVEYRRGRNRVLHCRTEPKGASWQVQDFRVAARRRKRLESAAERFGLSEGRGHIDVRRHFDSINLEDLARTLRSAGLDQGSVLTALAPLEAFQRDQSRTVGIPVGPEVSGVIGSAALLPDDRAVTRIPGVMWRRYVDDYDVYGSQSTFEQVVEIAQPQLARIGQTLNVTKSAWAPWGEDLGTAEHTSVPDAGAGPGGPDADDALVAALACDDYASVGRLLDRCRQSNPTFALRLVRYFPFVGEMYPQQVARLIDSTKASDRDFLGDFVEWATTAEDILPILRLHVVRAYGRVPKGADEAVVLYERGLAGLQRHEYEPYVAHLLASSNGSDEPPRSRRARVLKDVGELPGFECSRALIGSLKPNTPSRKDRERFSALAIHDARLKPVCAIHLAQ